MYHLAQLRLFPWRKGLSFLEFPVQSNCRLQSNCLRVSKAQCPPKRRQTQAVWYPGYSGKSYNCLHFHYYPLQKNRFHKCRWVDNPLYLLRSRRCLRHKYQRHYLRTTKFGLMCCLNRRLESQYQQDRKFQEKRYREQLGFDEWYLYCRFHLGLSN